MKRLLFSFMGVFCSILVSFPQGIGLVMSGGGAKGAVHIGVIQALEENDIPIDYAAGTSIGAIVGSMYAMGYTPQEMLDLLMSKDFYYWQTGKVEDNYQYYFRKGLDDPSFVDFNIPISKLGKKLDASILPNSLINPIQMNQAFMQLFAQANAQCGGHFDNLFVPFLCVASDIYNKKPVIFREGDLGDAVRASMSFPLVFKPIVKDDIPLWDGGIYDNFPVQPMKEAFHPQFIIGSVVANSGSQKPSEQGLVKQLSNMIMQKTDYKIRSNDGILLKFDLNDVELLDFDKAQTLYELGYNTTLAMVDSIKLRMTARRPYAELQARRAAYKASLPPLIFQNIYISGATEAQQEYIEHQIHWKNERFTVEDFKKVYFRLLTNSKIKEIMPHTEYDEKTQAFNLFLDIDIEDEIKASFGGNVSSLSANQIYLGFGYKNLSRYSSAFNLDAQLGNAYTGFSLMGKMEIFYHTPMDVSARLSVYRQKYYESDKLFIDNNIAAFFEKQESYGQVGIAFPLQKDSKIDMLAGYGLLTDYYYQSNPSSYRNTLTDKSRYNLLYLGMYIRKNSLDAKQFPINGQKHHLYVQYLSGNEEYHPFMSYLTDKSLSYIQLNIGITNYKTLNSLFNLGYLVESVLSNKELGCNYTSSVLQAPGFTPTPHSQLVFNEAFHANQYIAGGLIPIFKISSLVHLRGDFYGFMPIRAIKNGEKNTAYYGDLFNMKDLAYSGEISIIARLPFMSVSLYANHYSYPKANWNFGLNIGYLIFGPKFIL